MLEQDVDTPALLIDLDAFEHNLDAMMQMLAPTGVALRAHAKTHKSPIIAQMQIARGAVGQCVQKVGEAEVLAWGGVKDILVSNEIAGMEKARRFAALSGIATMAICVDDLFHVQQLEAAAAGARGRLRVLVEIDAGGGRCGIKPGADAVSLAKRIAASRHLQFVGLQAYHGGAQHRRTVEEREKAIAHAVQVTTETLEGLSAAGLKCDIVGGGGTGTFMLEAKSGVFTEIQAGSYIFMDADYARNIDTRKESVGAFRQSLFVLSTVMSQARKGTAVIDAGLKALTFESGMPLIWERQGVTYIDPSCEHGQLKIKAGVDAPALGEKLRVVPSHCDPCVDRFDWYVGVRNGVVECVWPVSARGCTS
ncbi:DSD1 family PLP-dependent enzyme [Candidatus Sumerlaeota bacterium]|nr:DSD1 family PLP-dependent enzyme [Candidatus Sumerlaeota bacterium]